MLLQTHVFGEVGEDPSTWKDPLNAAYEDFTAWRKRQKVSCSHKRFTYKQLVREEYGLYLNAKGYNARVLSEWLLAKVVEVKANTNDLQLDHEQMDLCEATLTLSWFFEFPPAPTLTELLSF